MIYTTGLYYNNRSMTCTCCRFGVKYNEYIRIFVYYKRFGWWIDVLVMRRMYHPEISPVPGDHLRDMTNHATLDSSTLRCIGVTTRTWNFSRYSNNTRSRAVLAAWLWSIIIHIMDHPPTTYFLYIPSKCFTRGIHLQNDQLRLLCKKSKIFHLIRSVLHTKLAGLGSYGPQSTLRCLQQTLLLTYSNPRHPGGVWSVCSLWSWHRLTSTVGGSPVVGIHGARMGSWHGRLCSSEWSCRWSQCHRSISWAHGDRWQVYIKLNWGASTAVKSVRGDNFDK